MKKEDYFSRISNSLFYGLDGYLSDSLLKRINNPKILLVLDYLYINRNIKGVTSFTLEDVILDSGFTPHSSKGKSTEQFRTILLQLHDLQIIKMRSTDLKLQQFNKSIFLIDMDKSFFVLNHGKKDKILAYRPESGEKKVDTTKLLLFYCYLLSRMHVRKDNNNSDTDDSIYKFGGKPQTCYPSYKTISKEVHISEAVIKKYIDILVELNLIRVENAGVYYLRNDSQRKLFESPNTYVLYDRQGKWEDELKESIRLYKKHNPDRVFIDGYKDNNKSSNGYISRITYLEKMGKATPEQISKRDELLKEKQELSLEPDIKFKIKSILSTPENSGMLLSQIYENTENHKLSTKYKNIEDSLHILDSDQLLIDYEYYTWLMVNYTPEKHKHYFNCVQKHISEKIS